MDKLNADVIIIGGSLGGTIAAYSACTEGMNCVLAESGKWLGGQLTSQAVPPDEHKYIETTGCTATYRAYREKVREHYRNHPFIADEVKKARYFCPGGSTVSRLAHPPKLALSILTEMLEPFLLSGKLRVLYNVKAVACDTDGDRIKSVTVRGEKGDTVLCGRYFLDATDTGELLPLSGTEYVTGAESRSDTGERLAPLSGNACDMQPVTYVAACDWEDGRESVIEKPYAYEYFRKLRMPYDEYPVLSMYGPDSSTGKAKRFGFFDGEKDERGNTLFGLFTYRRIVAASRFKEGYVPRDITLINWPQNDYFLNNVFGTADDAENLELSRQLTLSLVYWLQTEGGYRGLGLNTEVLGTNDGLAMQPYIRESRRIRAKYTVTAEEIADRGNPSPADLPQSVGVGLYHIDLHITTKTHTFFFAPARPFTIPLGCMIPVRMKNLIPACKNVGTTHLTNGCFRLHPVEWNIGEAAGYLAAFCVREDMLPAEVSARKESFAAFQSLLHDRGVMTSWKL